MRSRLWKRNGTPPLALAMVVLGAWWLNAAPPVKSASGRPIEFSQPSNSEIGTNVNQLSIRKDTLRQLENDLVKPFSTLPKGSLDGVADAPLPAPAPRPAISNKRIRDLLERKKNRMFMTPDDPTTGMTAEQIFNMREYDENGLEKKNTSPLDRYFKQQDKKRNDPGLSQSSDDDEFGRNDKGDGSNEPDFLKGLKASANDLKKIVRPEDKGSIAPLFKPVIPDFFGLDSRPPSREEAEIHRQRMSDYGNLIGIDSLTPPDNPLDSLAPVRANSWSDIYTPSHLSPAALPPGARPVGGLPGASLPMVGSPSAALPDPYSIAPVAAPQTPTPAVREAPRALPSILDFQRKF